MMPSWSLTIPKDIAWVKYYPIQARAERYPIQSKPGGALSNPIQSHCAGGWVLLDSQCNWGTCQPMYFSRKCDICIGINNLRPEDIPEVQSTKDSNNLNWLEEAKFYTPRCILQNKKASVINTSISNKKYPYMKASFCCKRGSNVKKRNMVKKLQNIS